jgi:hypothetical protein
VAALAHAAAAVGLAWISVVNGVLGYREYKKHEMMAQYLAKEAAEVAGPEGQAYRQKVLELKRLLDLERKRAMDALDLDLNMRWSQQAQVLRATRDEARRARGVAPSQPAAVVSNDPTVETEPATDASASDSSSSSASSSHTEPDVGIARSPTPDAGLGVGPLPATP